MSSAAETLALDARRQFLLDEPLESAVQLPHIADVFVQLICGGFYLRLVLLLEREPRGTDPGAEADAFCGPLALLLANGTRFEDALPRALEGTFIRAPRITAVHGACEVLARRDGDPVLVRKGALLAACFHPELTVGHPVTRLFADAARASTATKADAAVAGAV